MRLRLFIQLLFITCAISLSAQQGDGVLPLPESTYKALQDSTTSIEVSFIDGGNSLMIEGKNVTMFNAFIDNRSAERVDMGAAGTIMWLIGGRELISGKFYLGDSTGYVVFVRNGVDYVNRINQSGNSFLKGQMHH